jgi:hypothetical protein
VYLSDFDLQQLDEEGVALDTAAKGGLAVESVGGSERSARAAEGEPANQLSAPEP